MLIFYTSKVHENIFKCRLDGVRVDPVYRQDLNMLVYSSVCAIDVRFHPRVPSRDAAGSQTQ